MPHTTYIHHAAYTKMAADARRRFICALSIFLFYFNRRLATGLIQNTLGTGLAADNKIMWQVVQRCILPVKQEPKLLIKTKTKTSGLRKTKRKTNKKKGKGDVNEDEKTKKQTITKSVLCLHCNDKINTFLVYTRVLQFHDPQAARRHTYTLTHTYIHT